MEIGLAKGNQEHRKRPEKLKEEEGQGEEKDRMLPGRKSPTSFPRKLPT